MAWRLTRSRGGSSGRVAVELEEVHEGLGVAGAVEEHRPVRTRQGVHERRERTPRHAEEGIADRESLRTREYDVLEDVSDAGGVARRSGKENREAVVVVGTFDMDVARPGPLVLQLEIRAF